MADHKIASVFYSAKIRDLFPFFVYFQLAMSYCVPPAVFINIFEGPLGCYLFFLYVKPNLQKHF
jgi:hypothetical protein